MKHKQSFGTIIFYVLSFIILISFSIICFYPFYYIFIYSISSPDATSKTMLTLLPLQPTLENYNVIFKLPGIGSAFFISTARTFIGTFITLFCSASLAFVLTHKEVPFRKALYRLTIASMYIYAGLIPWYLTMRMYNLKDNFLLYVLPTAVSAYFVLLIKVYIESLPSSVEESAIIDGAGYFTIFIKITIPLIKPVLAAVCVFSAVNQWNSWFDNMILVDNIHLQTLQFKLWTFLNQAEQLAIDIVKDPSIVRRGDLALRMTPMAVRMTITMLVVTPILLVYPFLQRFFIKGILMGAVKA